MTRSVNDILTLMRRVISRPNANDPDSNDTLLLRYINDFYAISMNTDVRLFENFSTLEFTIDETNTTGRYTFNDVGASEQFVSISAEAFCDNNVLNIYLNPMQFYSFWDQFDTSQLTPGQPTDMLYYGNEIVFRTIPDQEYTIRIYGYKKNEELSTDGDPPLPFQEWYRYIVLHRVDMD